MLTVKQVAGKLGISASLVYGLCASGKLRCERYGLGRGCIRISPEALEEYRQGCTSIRFGSGIAAATGTTFRHLDV
jgi:excisionase family DNA binding protein